MNDECNGSSGKPNSSVLFSYHLCTGRRKVTDHHKSSFNKNPIMTLLILQLKTAGFFTIKGDDNTQKAPEIQIFCFILTIIKITLTSASTLSPNGRLILFCF
ncbi:hypothetical protein [Chryseobacterium sp. Mn2064]|uniref:hypothetical protein n=1 Tax=Chryseobacterium sp. Mn2064 TaxID=3395263 RepID=UPI003BE5345D